MREERYRERADSIAYGASLLHIFSQTAIYSISFYSEPLFLLIHLLAILILHSSCLGCSKTTTVQSGKILMQTPLMILGTFTRSTGALCTIVPIYFTVHKIARNLWGINVRKTQDEVFGQELRT